MTGTDSPPAVRPAGFWIRALAALVDLTVFALVQFSFNLVGAMTWGPAVEEEWRFQSTIVVFTLLFTLAYTVVLHALAGQTIGKLLAGIRVVTVEGGRVSPGTALLRYLACYVSLAVLGFGFLMAALRADRRALHDLLAGTRVERLPAARPAPASPPSADALTVAREPPP
jgi:uncharacterized RDD family membrane protein YckC